MKRFLTLLFTMVMICSIAATAGAERMLDENGNYFIDYDKSVYDENVFGDYTYRTFLQRHGSSSFDVDKFINSEYGQFYAKYAAQSVKYGGDDMAAGLLAVWRSVGMDKIMVSPEGAEDNTNNYYIYTPVEMDVNTVYPLVFVNHGSGASASVCESYGWVEIAGRDGVILVMAENTEPESLHGILEEVKASYPIDASRVYMTGSSQGGKRSKQFAGQYPTEIAAIAPMNTAFCVDPETEGDLEILKELGMPMLFVNGTTDTYHPLPVSTISTTSISSIDGWNNLMALMGYDEYRITAEESADLLANSTDLLEFYTGLKLPTAQIMDYVNCRTFKCDFTKDDLTMLSLVINENGPHDPLQNDSQLAWEFMRRFARDLESAALIVR